MFMAELGVRPKIKVRGHLIIGRWFCFRLHRKVAAALKGKPSLLPNPLFCIDGELRFSRPSKPSQNEQAVSKRVLLLMTTRRMNRVAQIGFIVKQTRPHGPTLLTPCFSHNRYCLHWSGSVGRSARAPPHPFNRFLDKR